MKKIRSELAAEHRSELLMQVERVVMQILKDHNVSDEVAELAASAVTDALSSDWAGQTLTFPKEHAWRLLQRDLDAYNKYNGRNHIELARELGIGKKAVYALVKRVKRIAQEQAGQSDMFKGGK